MAKKKEILTNHKKHKRKLIPPFVYKLGPLEEISWVKTIMPELVWIALIHHKYGFKRGVEFILSLAKTARIYQDNQDEIKLFGSVSTYTKLSKQSHKKICDSLKQTNELNKLVLGLTPIVVLYPKCPF